MRTPGPALRDRPIRWMESLEEFTALHYYGIAIDNESACAGPPAPKRSLATMSAEIKQTLHEIRNRLHQIRDYL
jgi:hypothetical protein